jgi:hypothetical protein
MVAKHDAIANIVTTAKSSLVTALIRVSTESELADMEVTQALGLMMSQIERGHRANEARATCLQRREENYLWTLSQVSQKLSRLLQEDFKPIDKERLPDKRSQIIDALSAQLKRLRSKLRGNERAIADQTREITELRMGISNTAGKVGEVLHVPVRSEIAPLEGIVEVAEIAQKRFDEEKQEFDVHREAYASEMAGVCSRLHGLLGRECVGSAFQLMDLIQDDRIARDSQIQELRERRMLLRNCLLDFETNCDRNDSPAAALSDEDLVARIRRDLNARSDLSSAERRVDPTPISRTKNRTSVAPG